jgi:hypothetical protein
MRAIIAQKSPHCEAERCAPSTVISPVQEDMMRLKNWAAGAAVIATLALAGCGTNPGDRAVSGGLLGAGAGAVVGAATGNAAAGAAIGGVAGAVVGATTDPCSLDLGDPFWKDHDGRAGYERRCGHPPP